MTPSCISELTIDCLLAGELSPGAAARARSHAAGCAACRALLDHAEATARRFAADPPRLRWPAPRRWRAIAAIAPLAIAVVAFGLAIRSPEDPARGVRTKGHAALGFFVSHDGQLRAGQPGEIVTAGDRLQLVTTTAQDGWIAVTGIDALGVRQVYAAPQPLAAGHGRPLPFSILLDATPGRSTITAVFCPRPFALERPNGDCASDAFTVDTRDTPGERR